MKLLNFWIYVQVLKMFKDGKFSTVGVTDWNFTHKWNKDGKSRVYIDTPLEILILQLLFEDFNNPNLLTMVAVY